MKTLSIFLGTDGDKTVAHHSTTAPGAHPGVIVAGPEKFVSFLELHLGLSRPIIQPMDRVLKLKGLLSELPEKHIPFLASWKTDSIGVSRRMLELWDSWRMSGWIPGKPTRDLPRRMKELLSIKTTLLAAGPGLADRIIAVQAQLHELQLPVTVITLMDPLNFFPPLIKDLVSKLPACCCVQQNELSPQATPGSDLRRLQEMIIKKSGTGKLKQDNSFLVLHFADDIAAANAVNAIQEKSNWQPLVVNQDHSLLNGLKLSGKRPVNHWQPASGAGEISQLFFLATAMFRSPADPAQVLAFLNAPATPFSRELARELAVRFADKPGFDNPEWSAAIADHLEKLKELPRSTTKTEAIAFWLRNTKKLGPASFAVELLIEIYTRLEKWSLQQAALNSKSGLQLVNLSVLCERLILCLTQETETITSARLERLQSQIFLEAPSVITEAQCESDILVAQPGAVWTATDELLWMNACWQEPARCLSMHWYKEEKAYFLEKGLAVQDEAHNAKKYAYGLERMILSARNKLVIVVPARINGTTVSGPFCLEEWKSKLDLQVISKVYTDKLSTIPWDQKTSLLAKATTIALPTAVNYLDIPVGTGPRDLESFSSLENLLQHPAIWYFQYKLNLKHYESVALPRVSRMQGNIADGVVEKVFTPAIQKTNTWQHEEQFQQLLQSTLTTVLAEEGFPFLEVSERRVLAAYTTRIIQSLMSLRQFIISNNFSIGGTQVELKGNIEGQPFRGFADLVLNKDQRDYIFDLKWSANPKSFQEKIETGRDLQLVIYRQLAPASIATGYILVNREKVLMREEPATSKLVNVDKIIAAENVSFDATVQQVNKAYAYRLHEMNSGKLETGYTTDCAALVYVAAEASQGLYPLNQRDDGYKVTPWDNDYDLLFGNIN